MINNLQSILTQNNLATESPIFCVYSKQDVFVGSDSDDYDECFYVETRSGEYCKLSLEEYEKLESAYNEATDYHFIRLNSKGEQETPQMPEDPCSGEDFDPGDWEIRYIKKIDKFEQAFFIRKNAENFIERNRHHVGDDAFIYVESAYRNPEWQQIRELLINKARIEGQDVTV